MALSSKAKITRTYRNSSFIPRLVSQSRGTQRGVHGLLQVPALSRGLWGQNCFYNNPNMLLTFFIVLTFLLLEQKQWWGKLLEAQHKSRQWQQTTGSHWTNIIQHPLFNKCQFYLRISVMKQLKLILLSLKYIYIKVIFFLMKSVVIVTNVRFFDII